MAYRFFIIAGEASGDLIGAQLIGALKEKFGTNIEIFGVGGSFMQEQGLDTIFPMSDLSIMGIAEVLPQIPKILKRIQETVHMIGISKPNIVITIDSPDFSFRVAKKVKKQYPDLPVIHYVAPTVWAWRPKRAKKIAQFLDGILCLFPFEPKYFEKEGLKAFFVGHPLATSIPQFSSKDINNFAKKYGLNRKNPVITILPGSRGGEIKRLTPVLQETITRLKAQRPEVQIIIPTLPSWTKYMQKHFPNTDLIIDQKSDKYCAFAISSLAIHASGTVALELALSGTPMITIYKISPLTAILAKLLIKTKHVNLVNILLSKPIIPELLQKECNTLNIINAVDRILDDQQNLLMQKSALASLKEILLTETKTPAATAADAIAEYL